MRYSLFARQRSRRLAAIIDPLFTMALLVLALNVPTGRLIATGQALPAALEDLAPR